MAEQHGRIFISYHRSDLELAGRIRQHLVARGADTWMDQFDIPAGAYWPDEIDKGLEAANTVVGLLSPDSVASRNVKNEWDWAIQNRKPLLLLQAAPCVIPHRYVSINIIDATGASAEPALETLSHSLGLNKPVRNHLPVPTTHYARSGEYSIAYQVIGEGPVDLILVTDFTTNIDHFWRYPRFAAVLRDIASFSRLILFDQRGTGLSDRPPGIATMEERMSDLIAVMDAAQSHRAVIQGLGSGAFLAVLFAVTYPERTQGLITLAAPGSIVKRSDYPWAPEASEVNAAIDELARTIHERWGTEDFAREMIREWSPSRPDEPEFRRWFAELMRVGRSPGAEIARQRMNADVDIRQVLPAIKVPTLVIYTTGDPVYPVEGMRYFGAKIPGAQIVELLGDDHFLWFDTHDQSLVKVRAFIGEFQRPAEAALEPEAVFATILSITYAGVDGDAKPVRELIDRETRRFRGRDVSNSVGSTLLTFDGPTRAIRCAANIRQALEHAGIASCSGLHAGEVTVRGNEADSLPARIARSIANLAAPAEILVSRTMKDLVAGSGMRFSDHGMHGVEALQEEIRLYVVDIDSMQTSP
jgi:pimeloyl-ACP methyl ester carboxylesterase